MAASFVAASSQYLVNSTPAVIDYPFTIGMWVNLTAVAGVSRTLFSLADTAVATHYLIVRMESTENIVLAARAGGSENTASLPDSFLVAGKWTFFVARCISSTNRKISGIKSDGTIAHATTATARAPTSMDTMAIGALVVSTVSEYWDGSIAEYWLSNADVQPDGAQLQNSLLWQLAYGGPFSVPHITKNIIEYRSFRKHPTAGEIGEVYWGNSGVQNWTNTNGVTIGPHVPLSAWYNRPPQTQIIRPPQNLLRSGIWSQAAPVAEVTMFDGFYPSMVDRSIKIIPY